jgi:hypothetical protein
MPARSERASRRRSSAASAAASGSTVGRGLLRLDSVVCAASGGRGLQMDSGGCAAAGRGPLLRTDSGGRRALLPERTRSGRRSAADLGPRLFCIVGATRRDGCNGREGREEEGSGKK